MSVEREIINYSYIHDIKCELYEYVANFLPDHVKDQVEKEIHRALQDIAFNHRRVKT